jgi:hypothetical protein
MKAQPKTAYQKRHGRKINGGYNAWIPRPAPPHAGIDSFDCVCGALYDEFRAYVRFADCANDVRIANGGFEGGGGFRSYGAVLWMMHIKKLQAWYEQHYGCSGLLESESGA